MGDVPKQSANTSQEVTHKMDDRLYEMGWGSSNAPGPQVMQSAARNAKLMNLVQQGKRGAVEQFYGAPPGADLSAYRAALGTANPGQTVKLAVGGQTKPAKATRQQVRRQVRQNTPFTMAEQYGVVPFFDPNTLQSTNPYYNQAISQLQGMGQAPWQYDAASQGLNSLSSENPYISNLLSGVQGLAENSTPYIDSMLAGMQDLAGKSWADPGVAESYMNPYAKNNLSVQEDLANRQFAQQQNQLNSQAAGRGAFGGSASALAQQSAQLNQNLANQSRVSQGMNDAYAMGMQGFNNDMNRQLQSYGQGLQGAIADRNLRLQSYGQGLQGAMSDLGRRLQANQGLLGAGQNMAAYNQGLFQNWGQAGNTLQNIGQNWFGQRANNANQFWNSVGNAAAPGMNLIFQAPSAPSTSSTQQYYGSR